MIQLPSDFKEFLQLLNSEKVEYLLIGGYAVGCYGYPRPTGDIDIWVASTPQNAARIVAALRAFGFTVAALSEDLFLQPDQIIRMGIPPLRIEILTSISGVGFAECYANKTQVLLDGVDVSLIGLADLKKNKTASGRLKDLNDLENI